MNKKLTISEIYVVLISLTCESENKNKPEHLLVQAVREKKYPNGPERPSFGRKNIFLNNFFFIIKKITSMLAYREWYVASTNQIV